MNPTLGRIVRYTLSAADVEQINKDRTEAQNQLYGQVRMADTHAAIITKVHSENCVDLKVLLGAVDAHLTSKLQLEEDALEDEAAVPTGRWHFAPEDYPHSGNKKAEKEYAAKAARFEDSHEVTNPETGEKETAIGDGKCGEASSPRARTFKQAEDHGASDLNR